MKVGHVPLVPYHRPGDPRRRRWWRRRITRQGEQGVPIRAVMLERLGPNVWHRSAGRGHAPRWKSWKKPQSSGTPASPGRSP
jgi:hypothetical protein